MGRIHSSRRIRRSTLRAISRPRRNIVSVIDDKRISAESDELIGRTSRKQEAAMNPRRRVDYLLLPSNDR